MAPSMPQLPRPVQCDHPFLVAVTIRSAGGAGGGLEAVVDATPTATPPPPAVCAFFGTVASP